MAELFRERVEKILREGMVLSPSKTAEMLQREGEQEGWLDVTVVRNRNLPDLALDILHDEDGVDPLVSFLACDEVNATVLRVVWANGFNEPPTILLPDDTKITGAYPCRQLYACDHLPITMEI